MNNFLYQIIHIVLNRWDRRTPLIPLNDIESNLGRKVDLLVSEDKLANKAITEGKLLRDLDRKASITHDMASLVSLVTDGDVEVEEKKPSGGLMSWLFRS